MEFRPCIDIHNGKVKQIVGGSLTDKNDYAKENFVSNADAAFYSDLYYNLGIKGGHVILLNSASSPYYSDTLTQAKLALARHEGFLQVGGGINDENAKDFINYGASHIIVTSYVFKDGIINYDNLDKLISKVGSKRIVLDLSCKKDEKGYVIVTDRWQNKTQNHVSLEFLDKLSKYCDEFLIHAVDVEGKCNGVESELLTILGNYTGKQITYAGGVSSYDDMDTIKTLGKSHVNVTIGSALDLFGGNLSLEKILTKLNSF